MNVLITGSNGFIGKNLTIFLREKKEINVLEFDRGTDFEFLTNNLNNIDFVFHLAGVNRPIDTNDFKKGNEDFTLQLTQLLSTAKTKIPLVITSSIQATRDNEYGVSKRAAEDIVFEYGKKNICPVFVYRLHNVFGKYCKPNYNSVVATFCHNIAHGLEISISNEENMLELVYIDDICSEFYNILQSNTETTEMYKYINPVYQIKLGELAAKLYEYKKIMNNINLPQTTNNEFEKKLFSTFVSYYDLDEIIFTPVSNVDERGSYTELFRTIDSGQFSVSHSKPGVKRGNHYHHTKMERFIVVKGSARIGLRKLGETELKNFYVSDKVIQIVTIPVGYTHDIENIGNDEMILIMWSNELFDKNRPDTIFCEVKK